MILAVVLALKALVVVAIAVAWSNSARGRRAQGRPAPRLGRPGPVLAGVAALEVGLIVAALPLLG